MVIISRDEFQKRRETGELYVALIGMSSVGKSHRAVELERELEWERICIDEEIAKVIADELPVADVHGLATWMGCPYEAGYAEREKQYLQLENNATTNLQPTAPGNLVLDTTGSFVYLDPDTIHQVKHQFLVVHLQAGEAALDRMLEKFFRLPKPVVWGGMFEKREGQSDEDAIRDCYPRLLHERMFEYDRLADVAIPAWNGKHERHSPDEFLDMICDKLPA